jgi:hypothetical protein
VERVKGLGADQRVAVRDFMAKEGIPEAVGTLTPAQVIKIEEFIATLGETF